MASNLEAMAFNLEVMASNLIRRLKTSLLMPFAERHAIVGTSMVLDAERAGGCHQEHVPVLTSEMKQPETVPEATTQDQAR